MTLKPSTSSCQVITFFTGVTEVCFMVAPVGDCSYCCSRDDDMDIQYQLFTRANTTTFQIITSGSTRSLRTSGFNVSNPTVVFLMGFSESATGPSSTTIKNAYLNTGQYNFIIVDWSRLIVFPWYISALRNTRYMGLRLADFVQFLNEAGVQASNLHVIGFSLGAEAAGFAGKELRRRGLLLGRITGLDPAYPGYSLTNSNDHLAKGDAAFVDVIHTNPGLYGFPLPIGDVDFYPNRWQWAQPGCWITDIVRNRELIYGCSHNRAWQFYAESVYNPRGFPATLCSDWKSGRRRCQFQVHGYMGFAAGLPAAGKMYLDTNGVPPFARNGP